MKKLLLLVVAVALVAGCKTAKKTDDSTLMEGQPFNLESIDDEILGGPEGAEFGGAYAGDLPAAGGTGMRFVEPDSGMLDPAIAQEAQMVLRDVHFPYNSSRILPEDARILEQISGFQQRFPQVLLQIQGYCDERGTEEYNMALGSRRAGAVRQFLADLGVDPNRLYTISYGEEYPVDPAHNETAWAKNRRAHFLVGVAGE